MKPKFIGLAGKAGSGKDSAREILERNHGYHGFAFADPIRRMLGQLIDPKYINDRDKKESPIPGLWVSYRELAQTLGTEWARECLCDNFWLKVAYNHMQTIKSDYIVISDVRFANEAQWVRNMGGILWQIDRPGLDPVREHISESDTFKIDKRLQNDGSLSDLVSKIDYALGEF